MGASESTGRRRSRSGGSTVGSSVEEIEHICTGGEDTAAIVIGVGAVVVLAGLVLWGLSDSAGSSKKMMKAPGRDGHMIYRHVFESDPSSYFRDLRRN